MKWKTHLASKNLLCDLPSFVIAFTSSGAFDWSYVKFMCEMVWFMIALVTHCKLRAYYM